MLLKVIPISHLSILIGLCISLVVALLQSSLGVESLAGINGQSNADKRSPHFERRVESQWATHYAEHSPVPTQKSQSLEAGPTLSPTVCYCADIISFPLCCHAHPRFIADWTTIMTLTGSVFLFCLGPRSIAAHVLSPSLVRSDESGHFCRVAVADHNAMTAG